MTSIKMIPALACLALLAGAPASDTRAQGTDADVLAAREAAQKGQWRALDTLRRKLAGHPLEAYPTFWALAPNLDRTDPTEVRGFLERYPRGPLAETVRRDWLRALGAAGSWALFREELPRYIGDDPDVACYALQERLARDDREVAGEARALFLQARDAPASCDPAFNAAAAAGRLGEGEAWERIRKLLAAGNVREAKRAMAWLPAPQRIADKALDRAQAEPAKHLAQEKAARPSRAAQELDIFAVARLARSKPEEAADRLQGLAGRLAPESQAAAWAQLAHQAAQMHHPRALEWYAKAAGAPLTDAQAAWRARAALRLGDWKAVLESIQALPPEEAREGAWRYWRARALRALGEAPAAEALLRPLAREPNFYGLLAADELGALPAPDWTGVAPQPGDLERARGLEGIERALILYRVGLDQEAFREWIVAIRGLDDRMLLAAAEVARLANVPDRAINTAERTVQLHDFAQRYPIPHREALSAAARQWELDEAILYSLIRQESRFMPVARSRVGATGLMQLMPATARWVAQHLPIEHYKPQMLVQPEVNIRMGTYYFRRVLTDLGHPILAAAAYNAGPGRAKRWRDERPLEAAIYAETIPFNETRDYVKKVFANAWFYRHRLTGQATGVRQMLGTVPGRRNEPTDGALAAGLP